MKYHHSREEERDLSLQRFKQAMDDFITEMENEYSKIRKYRYMETKRKVKGGELPVSSLAEFECWI